MEWDRSAIRDAATYLRELIDGGVRDARTQSVYDGLLDLLDPDRHATRIQRALATDAALAMLRAGRDRRHGTPRRYSPERRIVESRESFGDRRSGPRRRGGCDRRRT